MKMIWMKPSLLNRSIWVSLILSSSLLLVGCFFNFKSEEFQRAEVAVKNQKFKQALKHYSRIIKNWPRSQHALKSARKGSQIAYLETSDFITAMDFYRHLVIYSSNEVERIEAQKNIALIYFEKISDYSSAIREYSRLLNLPRSKEEDTLYRFNIVKSYFYLNNFYQATIEIKKLLSSLDEEDNKFEYLAFRGNILLTTKKLSEAVKVFLELMKKYPEEAMRENVPISLAVTYEEKGEFDKAVAVLEEVKQSYPTPEFIELLIKRLKDRISNLPGSKGLRK